MCELSCWLRAWAFGFRYPGAAPIHHVLLNNETTSGVSIIEVDVDRLDGGSVLKQLPMVRGQSALFLQERARGLSCVPCTLLCASLADVTCPY